MRTKLMSKLERKATNTKPTTRGAKSRLETKGKEETIDTEYTNLQWDGPYVVCNPKE